MSVIGHHMLDLFKLLPANVALMRIANQCPPLLSWFAPAPVTWLPLLVLHRGFCSAVRICARVRRVRQHRVYGGIPRSPPDHLVTRGGDGNLQSVFQKPEQRLPCRAEFEKLAEYQQHPFLHTAVRVLFQTVLALDITGGRREDR